MNEQIGLALVLLVAIASVASVLFLSGASPTASVIAGRVTTVTRPSETTCTHVACPNHAAAYPLLDSRGYVLYHDEGNPICVCPPRSA